MVDNRSMIKMLGLRSYIKHFFFPNINTNRCTIFKKHQESVMNKLKSWYP